MTRTLMPATIPAPETPWQTPQTPKVALDERLARLLRPVEPQPELPQTLPQQRRPYAYD
jgi:hypothetical protein